MVSVRTCVNHFRNCLESLKCITFNVYMSILVLAFQDQQYITWQKVTIHIITPDVSDPMWSIWTNWSTCTGECTEGIQSHMRECQLPSGIKSGKCIGINKQNRICEIPPCPIDDGINPPPEPGNGTKSENVTGKNIKMIQSTSASTNNHQYKITSTQITSQSFILNCPSRPGLAYLFIILKFHWLCP